MKVKFEMLWHICRTFLQFLYFREIILRVIYVHILVEVTEGVSKDSSTKKFDLGATKSDENDIVHSTTIVPGILVSP